MAARRVDREGLCGEPVLLAGDHRSAGVTCAQAAHCGQHDDECEETKEVHLPVGVERDPAEHAERRELVGGLEPREVQGIQEVLRRRHRKRQRRDREEGAADAQRRDPDDERRDARDRRPDRQGDEHVDTVAPDEQARHRGPESHEGNLPQRDVTGEAGQHDERTGHDRIDDDEGGELRARRRQHVGESESDYEQDGHQCEATEPHGAQSGELGRHRTHRPDGLPRGDCRVGGA